jgi:hypothetical protein
MAVFCYVSRRYVSRRDFFVGLRLERTFYLCDEERGCLYGDAQDEDSAVTDGSAQEPEGRSGMNSENCL